VLEAGLILRLLLRLKADRIFGKQVAVVTPFRQQAVNDNYIYPSTTIRNAYGAC
jgi:hypothetical protein